MKNTIRTRTSAYLSRAVMIIFIVVLSGCVSNPDVPTPSVSLSSSFHHGGKTKASDTSVDIQWWQTFGCQPLVSLVERTAVANYDIRIAVERAKQARAGTAVAESQLFPSVNVMASQSDSRTGLPSTIKQSMPDTQATRAGLDVAWEVDLFGGARAAASAAEKEAEAAIFGVHGAQLIAVSEVARQYFVWQGARQRLAILENLLQTQRDTERLTRSRYREGMASAFDVARAAGEAATVEAALPPLQMLMFVTESRIAVLTGADASMPVPELHVSEDQLHWHAPTAPIVGLPADLLTRRPDLLAAEQRLSAAAYRLAEAKANRFPKIFVSALFGSQALTLNDSLSLSASRYSNVAAAFTLPIFNSGRIHAGIDAQSARERESLLSYEQSILGAIEDVESSLSALAAERQRADSLSVAVVERTRSVAHATSLFREGQIDLLQVLDVQRARLATELTLAEINSQCAIDFIQLYKALGGGWQALPAPTNAAVATNLSSGIEQ